MSTANLHSRPCALRKIPHFTNSHLTTSHFQPGLITRILTVAMPIFLHPTRPHFTKCRFHSFPSSFIPFLIGFSKPNASGMSATGCNYSTGNSRAWKTSIKSRKNVNHQSSIFEAVLVHRAVAGSHKYDKIIQEHTTIK